MSAPSPTTTTKAGSMATPPLCSSKNLYRSSVLVLLGLILLSPFVLLKRDIVYTVVNEYVSISSSEGGVDLGRRALERPGSRTAATTTSTSASTSTSTSAPADCSPVNTESTVDGFFEVPTLETLGAWTSERALDLERSVSIVTQLSVDRLNMLENQCRSWDDALVAVIYVPVDDKKEPYGIKSKLIDIQRSIDSFFSVMESTPNTCALRVELVGQVIEDERAQPYPINALRNRAMSLAQSPLVFVLDVDFVASPRLGMPGDGYRDPEVWARLMALASDRGAVVVPAFELVDGHQMEAYIGEHLVKSLVTGGKAGLRKAYKQELVGAFNARDFEAGHGPTNTSRWIRSKDPHAVYKVDYQDKYEPFVVLARTTAPAADERFVGYGANKLMFVKSLEAAGFRFVVHGSGFVVHVPHPKTSMANRFIAHRKGSSRDPMDVLRDIVEEELARGVFRPVVRGCERELEEGR